jgi:hypothetical protein
LSKQDQQNNFFTVGTRRVLTRIIFVLMGVGCFICSGLLKRWVTKDREATLQEGLKDLEIDKKKTQGK